MTTTRYSYQIQIALLVSVLLHVVPLEIYLGRHVLAHIPLLKSLVRLMTESRQQQAAQPAPLVPRITFVEAPEPKPQPRAVPAPPLPKHRDPNIFMETHEDQTADTPPTDTQFYGTRNTAAANPDNPTAKESDTPFLEGEQTGALASKTVALSKPGFMPTPELPPVAPPPKPAGEQKPVPPPEPAEKPKEVPDEGLAKAEPPKPEPPKLAMLERPPSNGQEPGPITPPAPEPKPQPRMSSGRMGGDLATVKARMTASGVDKRGVAAFGVAESPFGAYDRDIIRAVQSRWYNILDQFGLDTRGGTVTLYFELYDDGSVRNLRRKENTAGEMAALWCEKAVTEAAPFEPLPEKLRMLIGGQARDVTFTFYY